MSCCRPSRPGLFRSPSAQPPLPWRRPSTSAWLRTALIDRDRQPRPGANAYNMLLREYGQISIVPHGGLFEITTQPVTLKTEI